MCNPVQSVADGLSDVVHSVGEGVNDVFTEGLSNDAVSAAALVTAAYFTAGAIGGESLFADAVAGGSMAEGAAAADFGLVELGATGAEATSSVIADTGLSAPTFWDSFTASDYLPSMGSVRQGAALLGPLGQVAQALSPRTGLARPVYSNGYYGPGATMLPADFTTDHQRQASETNIPVGLIFAAVAMLALQ